MAPQFSSSAFWSFQRKKAPVSLAARKACASPPMSTGSRSFSKFFCLSG